MITTLSPSTMTLKSGIELSYAESGPLTGSPVLLLHGYSDSLHSFSPLVEALPTSLRVIALSHRGHGASAKPLGRYSTQELARDAVDAMDELSIPRAVIVGHSMGSLVATRIAIDHPERVSGLVLIGAFKTLRSNPAAEALWRDAVGAMTDPIDPKFVRAFQESTLAQLLQPEFLEKVISESQKVPAHVWRSALASMLSDDFGDELSQIKAPTRIIWGNRDSFSLFAEQQALAAVIRNATMVVYEGAGHAPHWEEPRRAAADIAASARNVTAAPSLRQSGQPGSREAVL